MAADNLAKTKVVNIEYANGATASLTMSAFTESECFRKTVIHGTKGELVGDMTVFASIRSGVSR